jgi:hypothetical protein
MDKSVLLIAGDTQVSVPDSPTLPPLFTILAYLDLL